MQAQQPVDPVPAAGAGSTPGEQEKPVGVVSAPPLGEWRGRGEQATWDGHTAAQ